MHTIVKLIIGAILLIGSVMYVYDENLSMALIGHSARQDFITVVNGTVPAFMGLIGLFIVWLELDELKVNRAAKASK
jgi:hypothetical protein